MHLLIVFPILCITQFQWNLIRATATTQYPRAYVEPGIKKLTVHWDATDRIFKRTISVLNGNWTTTMRARANVSKFEFKNLVACKSYKICVRTFTDEDKVEQEVWLCGTPLPNRSEPVRNVNVHSLSRAKIQAIHWSQPKTFKNCFTRYLVNITTDNEPPRQLNFYHHGTHIIGNLTKNKTYHYTIQPIWNDEHGPISDVISEKTEAFDYSAFSPYNVRVINKPHMLQISWSIDKASESDIKNFLVTVDGKSELVPGTERHHTRRNLEPCKSMWVQIVAEMHSNSSSAPVKMLAKPMKHNDEYCLVEDE